MIQFLFSIKSEGLRLIIESSLRETPDGLPIPCSQLAVTNKQVRLSVAVTK